MVNIGKTYAELIVNIVNSVATVLDALGKEYLETNNEGRKWNNKQILGHLIDSAYHNHQRILQTIQENTMFYNGYDQDLCVDVNQYSRRDASEVLDSFIVIQRHFALMVAGLENATLTKEYSDHRLHSTAMQPFSDESVGCLSFLIWDYIFHLEHHFKQILPEYLPKSPSDYYL